MEGDGLLVIEVILRDEGLVLVDGDFHAVQDDLLVLDERQTLVGDDGVLAVVVLVDGGVHQMGWDAQSPAGVLFEELHEELVGGLALGSGTLAVAGQEMARVDVERPCRGERQVVLAAFVSLEGDELAHPVRSVGLQVEPDGETVIGSELRNDCIGVVRRGDGVSLDEEVVLIGRPHGTEVLNGLPVRFVDEVDDLLPFPEHDPEDVLVGCVEEDHSFFVLT